MASNYVIIIVITFMSTTAAAPNLTLATMNVRYETINYWKHLQFNSTLFKEFYDCLCQDNSVRCLIYQYNNGVTEVSTGTSSTGTTIAPKVFTCQYVSNTVTVTCNLVTSSSGMYNLKGHQQLQNFTYTTQPKCCTGILWEFEDENITFSTNQTSYTNCNVREFITSTIPAERTTLSSTTTALATSTSQVQETSSEVSSTWTSTYLTIFGDTYSSHSSKDENSIPVVIIGVVVAIVVIIILMVIVFIIWRRRKWASHQHGNNTTTSSTNPFTEIPCDMTHSNCSRVGENPPPGNSQAMRSLNDNIDQYEIQTSDIGICLSIYDYYSEIENSSNIDEGDDYDYSDSDNESSASKASRGIINTDYDYTGDVRPYTTKISTTDNIDEHYNNIGNHDNLSEITNLSDRSTDLYSNLGQRSTIVTNPYNNLMTPKEGCSNESKKLNDKSNFAEEKLELADVMCTKHYTNVASEMS